MAVDNTPPAGRETTETRRQSGTPTKRIGNYHLLQKIGEGGMGEVYLAEQEKPVRRKVALKLIKRGMDTKAVVARFEAERQALAIMNHPNVAKVFDAGATEQGRPYFVMEYVKGVPITEHCDTGRLTTRERLEPFMQVCEGVQHAHQKGIIHRDIKPTNVLVQVEGEKRVPKIIDFGVAKATQHRLTEKTVFTELGQWVGTPEYMSPEQADMTAEDIDTRTDVYSLGVLLYELLTGELPFDRTELRQGGLDEIRRKIREDEPPKPSTRLSSLGEASTATARKRRTDTGGLARQLRGDLDWITMKALEKDRTRRYASPAELAADIRRHVLHEPVLARPPSAVYRTRRFIQRHKVGMAASAVVLIALVLGMAGTGVGLLRAVRAERSAKQQAERANDEARTARAALEAAALSLHNLADVYKRQGEDDLAEPLYRDALEIWKEAAGHSDEVPAQMVEVEPSHTDTLESNASGEPSEVEALKTLADVLREQGAHAEAGPLYERALMLLEAALGQDYASLESIRAARHRSPRSGGGLALRFMPIATEEQLERLDLVTSFNLALWYSGEGRYAEAEPLFRRVKNVLEQRPVREAVAVDDLILVLEAYAQLLRSTGRISEADALEAQADSARLAWARSRTPRH